MNMEKMYVNSAANVELSFVASWLKNLTNLPSVVDWYYIYSINVVATCTVGEHNYINQNSKHILFFFYEW